MAFSLYRFFPSRSSSSMRLQFQNCWRKFPICCKFYCLLAATKISKASFVIPSLTWSWLKFTPNFAESKEKISRFDLGKDRREDWWSKEETRRRWEVWSSKKPKRRLNLGRRRREHWWRKKIKRRRRKKSNRITSSFILPIVVSRMTEGTSFECSG